MSWRRRGFCASRAGDGAPGSRPDHLRGFGFGQAALGDERGLRGHEDLTGCARARLRGALRPRRRGHQFCPSGARGRPLWRGANEQLALARHIATEQVEQEVAAALPRGKVAQTVELADVIVFLASPRAATSLAPPGLSTAARPVSCSSPRFFEPMSPVTSRSASPLGPSRPAKGRARPDPWSYSLQVTGRDNAALQR